MYINIIDGDDYFFTYTVKEYEIITKYYTPTISSKLINVTIECCFEEDKPLIEYINQYTEACTGRSQLTRATMHQHIVVFCDTDVLCDFDKCCFLYIDVKDNEDILDEEPFDFNTKIKKNTKLKAVYEGAPETITITFDSRGGSKVDSITINKGTELTLPSNPTYKGYRFVTWETANGTPVYDKALLSESMTLYAKWEKIEEEKPQSSKPEETISLSVDNKYLHRRGRITTAKVTANVQNSSNGKVTYSLSSTACAKIDSSTGVITAKTESEIEGADIQICEVGETVTVTGKLPSGKSASVKVNIEKDLYAHFTGSENNNTFVGLGTSKTFYNAGEREFSIAANQSVTWNAKCEDEVPYLGTTCKYIGKTSSTPTIFKGTLASIYTNSDGSTSNRSADIKVTFSTLAGQAITLIIRQRIN